MSVMNARKGSPSFRARLPVVSVILLLLGGVVAGSSAGGNRSSSGTNNSAGKVTLTVLYPEQDPQTTALWTGWWNAFAKSHGVTLKTIAVPFEDVQTKTETMAAAGDMPDVVYSLTGNVENLASQGILLPLNQYMKRSEINDIVPSVKEETTWKGKLYGVPYDAATQVLYYNKDLFAAANIATPPASTNSAAGWTWDQFLNAATKLTLPAGSANPTQYGLASAPAGPGTGYYYEPIFIRGMGNKNARPGSTAYDTWRGISPDGKKAYVDTPQAVAAMTWYQKLFQTYHVTPLTAVPNQFLDGTAAMEMQNPGVINELGGAKFNWGVAILPHWAGHPTVAQGGSDTWVVSAHSKNAKLAAGLALSLTTPAVEKQWANWNHGFPTGVPARKSVLGSMTKFHSYPWNLVAATLLNDTSPIPIGPGAAAYVNEMGSATKDIALGTDPASRLAQAQNTIDTALANQ
jgi:fructooligosaccharide transport system substrate-binding protein